MNHSSFPHLAPTSEAHASPTPQTQDAYADLVSNDLAVQSYQQAQRQASPGEWSSGLHLGADQVTWAAGVDAPEPTIRLRMPLGGARTAHRFFRGAIPVPLELENAIAAVEDEVHTAHRELQGLLRPGQSWAPWSADPSLRGLATLAGVPPGPRRVMTIDAMERMFNRLVAVSEGRPAAHEGLPDDPSFAGTLLVLRELMHHLPFASVTLVDNGSEGG